MVIIEMSGGLGNQMFQYALYRKFESLHKEVALDTSFFRSQQRLRKLEIGIFDIKYREITDKDAAYIRGYGYHDSILDKIRYRIKPSRYFIYEDKIEMYQPEIFDMNEVYLSGYWQNEKYFSDIAEEIRKEFHFHSDMGKQNEEILCKLQMENSVSIHIRRSDYLSVENKDVYGNICTEKYYENAVAYIEDHVTKPYYYLFTDDVEWVKEHMNYPNMTIVEQNTGKNAYMDMYLMSQCKHNIIANSSFSWWGAWLNQNDSKIVLAPEKWFGNHKTADIICEGWIPINNK